MKRLLALLLSLTLSAAPFAAAFADTTPPPIPSGSMPQNTDGTMPSDPGSMTPPDGSAPSDPGSMTPPDGSMPPQGGNAPSNGQGSGPAVPPGGGQQGAPETHAAVVTVYDNEELSQDILSTGKDENALLVTGGSVTLKESAITRASQDSTGGDASSFYGTGAAILATGGELTVSGCTVNTDAAGGAGVFSYGDAIVTVTDSEIFTTSSCSGGIHVAGGGTLTAENLNVITQGESAAAIRSDRGGGTMTVNGGSYTSNGTGSPAVYVTANIDIANAELTANGSEALCLEGLNNVSLTDCVLSGNMPDDPRNETTWTVILYQSMSGDAQQGCGTFTMEGGELISKNGGIFYTTNTESVFNLNNVTVTAESADWFLRCTGNTNQRGWGTTGSNGAVCTMNALNQAMNGDIVWDTVSELTLNLNAGTVLTGAVIDDESCAGEGGNGFCTVNIAEGATWNVTGNSVVTTLNCLGTITGVDGGSVTLLAADGSVISQGTGSYTVTVLGK